MNKEYILKRSTAYVFAIFLSIIAAHFYPFTEKFWIPIAAIVVMQTVVGVKLRQGVLRFITMVISIVIATLLAVVLQKYPMVITLIIIFIATSSSYLAIQHSLKSFIVSSTFLFAIILVVVLLLPISRNILYIRLCGVTLGAAIGIMTNLIILPTRVDVEFRKNIIPVLTVYGSYFLAIINLFFKKDDAKIKAQAEKIKVEKILQAHSASFPIWVYEPGLSMVYQQGHRHFLIMIERLSEILFSMHQIAKHEFDPLLLRDLQVPLENFSYQAEKIIIALTTVMNLNKLAEGVSDLNEEMIELENVFKKAVPLSLELIDMSQDYILCAALIADLKDMRATLIRLGQALRQAAQ